MGYASSAIGTSIPEQEEGEEEMRWQFRLEDRFLVILMFSSRWKNSSDNAIYGPYTSSDLLGWVKGGNISDTTPVDLREVSRST